LIPTLTVVTHHLPVQKSHTKFETNTVKSYATVLIVLGAVLAHQAADAAAPTISQKKSDLEGVVLKQRNRVLGLMDLEICPTGVKFQTALVDGYLEAKTNDVILISHENKAYKRIPLSAFRNRMASAGSPMLDPAAGEWTYIMKKIGPGKPFHGFKTIELDYVYRCRSMPVEFPDQLLIAPNLPAPPKAMMFFQQIVKLPIPANVQGVPVSCVETVRIHPTKTVMGHETLSVTPKQFTMKDFSIPKGYRQASSDSDVYKIGLNGF
jgi:hypothetical protein